MNADPVTSSESYYGHSRPEIVKYIPDTVHRLLDVGCGEGNFGGLLKSMKNIEVWGIELNKEASAKATLQIDKVLVGKIEDLAGLIPESFFDCITFNDILEHLKYPDEIIRSLSSKLVPGGFIVASIPNVRFIDNLVGLLLHKDWKYTDEGVLDITHLRFYTRKSIVRLFHDLSFEIEKIEGINPRTGKWWFNLLAFLFPSYFSDTHHIQFAVRARKLPR